MREEPGLPRESSVGLLLKVLMSPVAKTGFAWAPWLG
jgi:hypothetical protein